MYFIKTLAIIGLLVAGYCQDHHHHAISLQSIVQHELPQKAQIQNQFLNNHQIASSPVTSLSNVDLEPPTPQLFGHIDEIGPYDNLVNRKNIPVKPAPVYEAVQDTPPVLKSIQHQFVAQPVVQPVLQPIVQTVVQPVQHLLSVKHSQPIQYFQPAEHHNSAQSYQPETYRPVIHQVAPELHTGSHHDEHHVEYYAHPKYEFQYKVEDPHSGDRKYQHESRDGDVVKGVYSLHEPDGSIRTVKYASDKKTGFTAEVLHEGHSVHKHESYHH